MSADEIQRIAPPGYPVPAGHYSPAVVANGFVFVSGQLPVTGAGVRLTDAPFEEQAKQALENVRAALVAGGSSIDRLVQVRVYITDMAHWPAFNAVYAIWAGDAKPARAVIPCGALHHGLLVEVEAMAVV